MSTNDYVSKFKNIGNLAKATAAAYTSQPCMTIVLPNGMNGNLSFSELEEKSNHFAVYLREVLKLKPKDKVAIQMPNCLSYPIAALGVFKAGCILVNMNPLYTLSEMSQQLMDSDAQLLVTVDLFADKAEQVLKENKVKHILCAELTAFMPVLPKLIANLVLKYWDRKIPSEASSAPSFLKALKEGAKVYTSERVDSYLASITPDEVAVLQYTGGTTGVSKGAMLSHRNLLANIHQVHLLLDEKLKPGVEVALTALPLYHIFAFSVNFLTFHALGARNILIPNPKPISNLRRAFENYPVSAVSGVNTLYNALNNEDWFMSHPPKTLKVCVAGGMALQSSVAATFKKITGIDILEGYGLTETSPVASFNIISKPKPGSIGLPVLETEFKLVDSDGKTVTQTGVPGEIAIRGPQVMLGYWNKPDETKNSIRDGWFFTGDIGTFDDDKYYAIVDRKKDMILVSGFNVYPNEVEDVLSHHPDVLEVAVIGVPDPQCGEACLAFIVSRGKQASKESLNEHCRKSLVGYKVPKDFIFRAELPKSNVGKILRKDLRAEVLHQKGRA